MLDHRPILSDYFESVMIQVHDEIGDRPNHSQIDPQGKSPSRSAKWQSTVPSALYPGVTNHLLSSGASDHDRRGYPCYRPDGKAFSASGLQR